MKTHALFVALLLVAALSAPAAASPGCSLPPSGAWSTGATKNGTFDARYVGKWSPNQTVIDLLWGGLDCEQGDWDDGWGYEAVWNLNLPLSRLLNAAWLVRTVQTHAKHYGKWHQVSGIPADKYRKGYWWDFVDQHGEDEWEPTCDDDDAVASYGYVPFDWFYTLHISGAYRYPAPNRASTLVHETTHEDVGHIDEDACSPPSGSCDSSYGTYNSNTMQINYLIDAATTFKTTFGSDGATHEVVKTGDSCALIPFFSDVEREVMQSRAEAVGKRFQGSAFIPYWEIDDAMDDSVWECKNCNTGDWTFDPNKCQQKACNQVLNPANAGINESNKGACSKYNGAVAASDSADDVANAKAALTASTKGCLLPGASYAKAYCDAQIAKATVATDIDKCGWLDTANGPNMGTLECVARFCEQKYLESEGVGWETDDPYGCLDVLCEEGGCGDEGTKEECVFGYNLVQGDPEHFVPSCGVNGCTGRLVHCVYEALQAGTWSEGDPYPSKCTLDQQLCIITSRLAGLVAVSLIPEFDPGPLHESLDHSWVTNPAAGLFDYMTQLSAASTSGAFLDAVAIGMTAAPERAALLYNLSPSKMAWLYGSEAFVPVAGPGVAWVKPVAISPSELTPIGQGALTQLQDLMKKNPGGALPAALGSVTLK